MKEFQSVVQDLLHNHERHRRYVALLTVLCMIMSFTVSLILIEPAESRTGELICEYAEHVHSEECYALAEGEDGEVYGVLTCEEQEHVHSQGCYSTQSRLALRNPEDGAFLLVSAPTNSHDGQVGAPSNGNGAVASLNVVSKSGGKYNISITYALPENFITNQSNSAYFTLSDNIDISQIDTKSGAIVGASGDSADSYIGKTIGHWYLETDDEGHSYIVVVFDEPGYIDAHTHTRTNENGVEETYIDAISGDLSFDAEIGRRDTGSGNNSIQVGDKTYEFDSEYGASVSKTMAEPRMDLKSGQLSYQIIVTAGADGTGAADSKITIVDEMSDSGFVSLDIGSTVELKKMDANGNVIGTVTVNVSRNGNTITIEPPALGPGEQYVLDYTATIDTQKTDAANLDIVTVGNTVTVTTPDNQSSSSGVKKDVPVDFTVKKNGVGNSDGTFTWTITVNNPRHEPMNGFHLTDNQLAEAIDGSFKFTPEGAGSYADGRITLNSTNAETVTIEYKTKAPFADSVTNKVQLTDEKDGPLDEDEATATSNTKFNIQKSANNGVDYQNGTITWEVIVEFGESWDSALIDWSGLHLEDMLNNNTPLPSDTIVNVQYWKENKGQYNSTYDWSDASQASVSNGVITVPAFPEESKKIRLTYTTKVDDDILYNGGSVSNNITLKEKPNASTGTTAQYYPGYGINKSVTLETGADGKGYYVWTVTVYSQGGNLKGMQVKDYITKNNVGENPFKNPNVIVEARKQSGGDFRGFKVNEAGNIEITEDVYETIIFTYKTEADLSAFAAGEETVKNGAGLIGPGGSNFGIDTPTVSPEKPFDVQKSGQLAGDYNENVDWEITITNEYNQDLNGYKVTDTKLHRAIGGKAGITIIADGVALQDGDFEYTVHDKHIETGSADITFTKPINARTIIIRYSTEIVHHLIGSDKKIHNDATLNDPHNTPVGSGRASVDYEERFDFSKTTKNGKDSEALAGANASKPSALQWYVDIGRAPGGLAGETYSDTLGITGAGKHYITKAQAEALTIVDADNPSQYLMKGTDYTITWKAGNTSYTDFDQIPANAELTGFEIVFDDDEENETMQNVADIRISYQSTADVSGVGMDESTEFTNTGSMEDKTATPKYTYSLKKAYEKYDATRWSRYHMWKFHESKADWISGIDWRDYDFSEPTSYSASELDYDEESDTYFFTWRIVGNGYFELTQNNNGVKQTVKSSDMYSSETDVVLYDTIPENLTFVEAKFTKSVDMADYEYDTGCTAEQDGDYIVFTIPGSWHNGGVFFIDYTYSISGEQLRNLLEGGHDGVGRFTFSNTVSDRINAPATQEITVEEEVLSKRGNQDDDAISRNYVYYELDFNKDGKNLSSGETVTLIDTIYSADSYIKNEANNQDGLIGWWDHCGFQTTLVSITIKDGDTGELLAKDEYDVTFDSNYKEANYSAIMTLVVPDERHLIINYTYHLEKNYDDSFYQSGVTVYNKVRIASELVSEEVGSDNVYYLQESDEAKASAGSSPVSVIKVETGKYHIQLQGADFQLYHYDNGNGKWFPMIGRKGGETPATQKPEWGTSESDTPETITTNDTGRALLPVLEPGGTYKLVEVNAPSGYIRSTEPYYFFYQTTGSIPKDLKASDFHMLYEDIPDYIENTKMTSGSVQAQKTWHAGEENVELGGGEKSVKFKLYQATNPPSGKITIPTTLNYGNNSVTLTSDQLEEVGTKIVSISVTADANCFSDDSDVKKILEILGLSLDFSLGSAEWVAASADEYIDLPNPLTFSSESASAISSIVINLEKQRRITITNEATEVSPPKSYEGTADEVGNVEINLPDDYASRIVSSIIVTGDSSINEWTYLYPIPSWQGITPSSKVAATDYDGWILTYIFDNVSLSGIKVSSSNIYSVQINFTDGTHYKLTKTDAPAGVSLNYQSKGAQLALKLRTFGNISTYAGDGLVYEPVTDEEIIINGTKLVNPVYMGEFTLDGNVGEYEVEPWLLQIDDLPMTDGDGQPYYYYLMEVEEEEYDAEYVENGVTAVKKAPYNVICVSNESGELPPTKSVKVTKTWSDKNNPDRPTQIQVQLYQSTRSDLTEDELADIDALIDAQIVTAYGAPLTIEDDGSGKWEGQWSDLPRYVDESDHSKGQYYYYVKEIVPEGYAATVTNNGTNSIKIKNTLVGDIDVDKTWSDSTGLSSITFDVYCMAKAENTQKPSSLKVLAVGDSITHGYLNGDIGYLQHLINVMADTSYGYNIEVNKGEEYWKWKLGYSSHGIIGSIEPSHQGSILARFQNDFSTQKPDVVLLMAGTNDVLDNYDLGTTDYVLNADGSISNYSLNDLVTNNNRIDARLKQLIDGIYTKAAANGSNPVVFLASIPDFNIVHNGELLDVKTWFWSDNRGYGSTRPDPYNSPIADWQAFEDYINGTVVKAYNAKIKALAEALNGTTNGNYTYNIQFVDTNSVMKQEYMLKDGCHPDGPVNDDATTDRSRVLGEKFARAIYDYYAYSSAQTNIDTAAPSGSNFVKRVTINKSDVIVDDDGTWHVVIKDLPIYDENGNELVYYVTEVKPNNFEYSDSYQNNGQKPDSTTAITVCNKKTVPKTKLQVIKRWIGDSAVTRPGNLNLTLWRTTTPEDESSWQVVDTAMPVWAKDMTTNTWTLLYEELDSVDEEHDNAKYWYKVTETLPNGYTDKYTAVYSDPDGIIPSNVAEPDTPTLTITNIKNVSVEIEKQWQEGINSALEDDITIEIHRSTLEPNEGAQKLILAIRPTEDVRVANGRISLPSGGTLQLEANQGG